MKIFVSWSGPLSKRLAKLFADWLPTVIQAAEPFFSIDDISKGARWGTELAKALEEARVGVIILTKESLASPWVLFEAGALSRTIDQSQICPILFGIEPNELPSPLLQFQVTLFDEEDFRRLIQSINSALGDYRLLPKTLEIVFNLMWPSFYEKANRILTE